MLSVSVLGIRRNGSTAVLRYKGNMVHCEAVKTVDMDDILETSPRLSSRLIDKSAPSAAKSRLVNAKSRFIDIGSSSMESIVYEAAIYPRFSLSRPFFSHAGAMQGEMLHFFDRQTSAT